MFLTEMEQVWRDIYLLILEKQWENKQNLFKKKLPDRHGKNHDVEGRGMEIRPLWMQSVINILSI